MSHGFSHSRIYGLIVLVSCAHFVSLLLVSTLLNLFHVNDAAVRITIVHFLFIILFLLCVKVILFASEHICSIVRYCFRSFKQL